MIKLVQQGYSGYGGPLMATGATNETLTQIEAQTAKILGFLNEVKIYRIAREKVPLAHPIQNANRLTSGCGRRWGRMHDGENSAAPLATPIHSTTDGIVIQTGWMRGYRRLVKIKHDFGFETRNPNLSKIRIKNGQRLSRGDHKGDMEITECSTGTHLYYEIWSNATAVNPMKYIKATRNVF